MPPSVEKAVQDWVAVRGDAPGPLFTNFDPSKKKAGSLNGSSIYRIVVKYGLGHTHGLRHLGITEYSGQERDIIKVMKFARHKDPKTTMIYIDNLKEANLEAGVKLAEIREKRAKETGNGPAEGQK
jgi:integrase